MSYIQSYCNIFPGIVLLNGEEFLKLKRKPFVMNDFFAEIYTRLGIDYRKFYKMDALSKLGFLASEILLSGSDREQPKPDMGIIFFNRSSSLEADGKYQKTIQEKDNFFPSPAEFVYTLPNIVTGEIAIRNKIHGETAMYVSYDFYSELIESAIDYAMKYAGIKCALAGWVEVDEPANKVDCCMMLCTAKVGNERNSHLPAGLKNIQAGINMFLDKSAFYHVYYKNKKQWMN